MPDYTDDHKTAHNSLVVCAAELGLFGLYFWSLFLFSTVRDALVIASPTKVTEGEPIVPEESLFPQAAWKVEDTRQGGDQPPGAFDGFVADRLSGCGWFLSRAYVMTFFLLGGMAEVVFQMALERKMIAPRAGPVLPCVLLAFSGADDDIVSVLAM